MAAPASAANIADWLNIHGLDQRMLDFYSEKSTYFGSRYTNEDFSRNKYIRQMKLKERFIRELHQLLTHRIPSATHIIVRLEKDSGYINKRKSKNKVFVFVEEPNPIIRRITFNFTINMNTTIVPPDTHFYVNPADTGRRGLIIKNIIYDTVNELKLKYAKPLIKELSRMAMRPPSGNNRGGLTYRRIANSHKNSTAFSSTKGGRLTRKRRS